MEHISQKKSYILFLANVFPEDCPNDDDILKSMETIDEKINYSENEENDVYLTDSSDEELPNIFSSNFNKIEEVQEENDYDNLPMYFSTLSKWPKTTNLLCWYCNIRPVGMPWFIPIGICKKSVLILDEKDEYSDKIEDNLFSLENISEFVNAMPDYQITTKTKEEKNFIRHGCYCTPFCAMKYIKTIKDPKVKNKWEAKKLLLKLYEEIYNVKVRDIPEAEDKTVMMQFSGPKGITVQEYRKRNENIKVLLFENI